MARDAAATLYQEAAAFAARAGLPYDRPERALRQAVYEALSHMDNADVLPILRQSHEIEMNPQVRETLGELLRRH